MKMLKKSLTVERIHVGHLQTIFKFDQNASQVKLTKMLVKCEFSF